MAPQKIHNGGYVAHAQVLILITTWVKIQLNLYEFSLDSF